MLNTYYTENILGLKDAILEKVEEIAGTKHIYIHMEQRIRNNVKFIVMDMSGHSEILCMHASLMQE